MKIFYELSSWSRKAIVSIFIAAMLFAACGDDDSSFAPQDEDSSSSACEECDESSSSSKDDVQSGDSHDSSARTSTGSSSTSKSSSSSSKDVMSSSSAKSSSSVAYVEPCRADSVDTCEYGTLTDARDGQTYKTVTIGSQTWMAQNLNYAYTGVPYKYDVYSSDSTSWCNNDDASNCAKYGRLYTWAVAMDSVGLWSSNGKGCGTSKTCSPTYPVRGVCPEGWHLPTQEEWRALFTAVGGKAFAGERLKTTSGWSWDEEHNISGNGTDAYAFSALPVAGRDDWGYYGDYAYNTRIWSSNENDRFYADCLFLGYEYSNAFLSTTRKYYGYPVRCLKDEGDVPASSGSTAKSSSSLAKSSSSVTPKSSGATGEASPCSALPGGVCDYDTLTDTRDGQTYKTVTIGDQVWMAENLNYAYTGVPYNYSGHGPQMARAAAMVRHAHQPVLYAAFAPRAGTYRTPRNGTRCSRPWAAVSQPVRLSSPLAAGMKMKAKAATVRILSGSRRCLPATGTTVGITTTRATTRTSGVLRSTIATTRTTCACTTTTTSRTWASTVRTAGILFVA